VPRPAQPRGTKNHALNYRVVVDESINYEERRCDNTWREFARRQRRLEEELGLMPARQRATCGVLNRLHLDSTKSYNNVPNELTRNTKKNEITYQNEKKKRVHTSDTSKTPHARYQYQYHETEPSISDTLTPFRHKSADSSKSQKQAMLVPISTASRANVMQRKVDNRLNGADLYVVRQARKQPQTQKDSGKDTIISKPAEETELASICSSLSNTSIEDAIHALPTSLHDELKCKVPADMKTRNERKKDLNRPLPATSSRPCYRCISYMHQAGIRRVFWTNHEGEWEGGKVRDLVDSLGLNDAGHGDADDISASIFVTKHEILILRQQMGGGPALKS
jgi:hypothetical protein